MMSSLNVCRVCRKEIKDGEGRYNDHKLFGSEVGPICIYCAANTPDAMHLAYKRDKNIPFSEKQKEYVASLGHKGVEDMMRETSSIQRGRKPDNSLSSESPTE